MSINWTHFVLGKKLGIKKVTTIELYSFLVMFFELLIWCLLYFYNSHGYMLSEKIRIAKQ
ncbi:hypothetical protein HTH_1019 [Hydrogenobacter thermophilus TK-6]|uniref:Uncharacterized protein n=1 Tax=Hydrogenobacter thermophilus (strain DSM 6534 / IAM 12695 / TK-6) TaxID=608538 RepID=D3DI25_HYDTT|nr:hypothetical protein HTH_1019 [Hydrogenobacter thermophilus TK-6]